MTDAAPSNYGDRYHFVYAAKLMLGLLPPNSKLSLIEMENISVIDKKIVDDPNYLLGVDLSAYYEGKSFKTASSIELTQVKASPLHPNDTWTLTRLVRDKRSSAGNKLSGTSVLRKLANMFDVAYSEIGSECREKVCIKLVTNQALQAILASQLASIQNDLYAQGTLSDTLSGRYIRKLTNEGNTLLVEMQEKTNLSWKRLSAFLRCWDLSAFGQSMLLHQETEFAQLLDKYVDMGIHFGNLINFVEEHAISNRRTDITKEQVFGMLRLSETSFFPAPASFDSIDQLQVTEGLERVEQLIAQTQHSVLLVHGVSGTGKSSTLQLLQHHNIDDKAVVTYDCFGNGQGVGLDTRRFPFKNFYVQIINELALRFDTNLFVTTQIDSDSIRLRFSLAIAKAAKAASEEGKELIIAVDAIDDAAEAALEQANLQDDCFVPTLWQVRWPENCKLVVTTRTENKHLIKINCGFSEIELEGFSLKETDVFLQSNGQIADKEIIQFSHQRTKGNPRVLSKLIDAIAHEQPDDLRTFIDQHAEATTFEYYRKQVPKALGENQNYWLLLAILREATQFITVEELSTMSSQPQRNIRSLVGRLYFGLHITDENEITWPDKDFISYVRNFSGDYIEDAQKLLAEYCLQQFESSEYAQRHLSRHLFRAGKRKELIAWWMSDDRLIKKLIKSQPHTEDVAGDIQYALLSAIKEEEFEIALKVLALAAEIAQGLDVFSAVATDYPRVIAEQGYTGRLLGHLRRRDSDSDLMPTLFSLARALAEYTDQHEIARQLYEEGLDVAERIKRRFKKDTIWANKTILDIAVYKVYADGLASGLDSLTRWKPEDSVAKFYTDLIYLWCQENDAKNALEIIQNHTLSDRQKAYAYLGILKNGNLASHIIQELAVEVLVALNNKVVDKFDRSPIYDRDAPQHFAMVLDSLIRHEVKDTASEILTHWHVSAPTSRHHVEIDYVQRVAYQHYLGIEPFDPDLFEIPENKPKDTKEASSSNEYKDSERKREVSEIRTMLKLLYPPRLIRLHALSGEAPEMILQEINAYIDEWWGQSKPYWYTPFFSSHVQSSCGQLIEAVCYLPNYHEETIKKIIDLSERLTGNQGYHSLKSYIDILSRHTKYQAEAERLIYQQLETITVPNYGASDAVTALLELYPAALRLDQNLALNIFMKARIEAGGWDNRLDGAAYALLATLQHSQPVSEMTVDQLNQLAAVFQVIEKVTDGYEVEIHLDWFIRLLTSINPNYSLVALFDFDQSGFMSLQDSVEGVAHGLLDQSIPSETIYPLLHMMDTVEEGTSIYQRAILSAQGEARDSILNAYCRYVQIETERDNRAYFARELVDWTKQNNLFQYQAVLNIDTLATKLEAFKSMKAQSKVDETDYDQQGQKLFTKFKNEIEKSPQSGLQVFLDASSDDLCNIQFALLSEAIQQLSRQLPSSRINDILQIVERFNERSYEPKAFSLLVIVAENSLPSLTISNACMQSLERMLRPAQIDLLTRWWYREHLDTLLSCDALDKHNMLQVFLRAASKSLSSLHANELYRLVGGLSRMLEPQQSFSLYETLHTRAVSKLPADYSCSITPYSSGDLYAQYIKFLADALGHPDQRLCWSVLYTLVDICIKRPNPSIALLIDELDDKSHARWMTKRVWLLVLFQHLALRGLSELVPFVQDFADIALDKVFPHAKMRYHAKQIISSLASSYPELVGNDVMESIAKVNQPHSTLEKEDHSPNHGRDEDNDDSWTFDWDTTRYWYSGLEDCFGGNRLSVASAARNWILDVMGISAEQAHYKKDWVSKKYDYGDTSHAQGGFPKVETLRLYAELHAMYLVAGEFVDKYPAYLESWSNETRWEDYERYRVRGLDPALPIRLAQPLPTTAANYGSFSTSYIDWVKKDKEQEFLAELWKDEEKKELVVAATFGSNSDERDWDVIIDSYFVNPEASASLARLINSQADFIALPHSHYSPYNYSLSDLAEKPPRWNDDDPFFDGESNIGVFKLFGWTFYWSQELPQHNLDTRQERYGISLEVLAPPFLVQNSIQLDPLTLEWHQEGNKKIGYSEFWSDREGRGRYENFISGRRLIIHREFIQDYLEKSELELLVTVRLRRNRPYTDQYRKEREYDHGTIRAFVINANGEAKLYMEQNLIKKGQELIDEFSNERESTLHRWMAHHLTHLMQVIESAETDDERQAASEKYADLISKLWAVQTEDKTTKLQQKLWNVIRVPSDELDLAALSDGLNNPPKNEDLSPETWNKLFQLVTEVERWLWRVSTLSVTVDDAAEEFSLDDFFQRESIPDLIIKLTQVFPEFAGLDITNKEDTYNRVSDAMQKLYILRQSLVWKSDLPEE